MIAPYTSILSGEINRQWKTDPGKNTNYTDLRQQQDYKQIIDLFNSVEKKPSNDQLSIYSSICHSSASLLKIIYERDFLQHDLRSVF